MYENNISKILRIFIGEKWKLKIRSYSPLNPEHQAECLAYKRCSINVDFLLFLSWIELIWCISSLENHANPLFSCPMPNL